MKVKISKWGNSLGLRLPKSVAEGAGLKEGQVVDVAVNSGGGGLNVREVGRVPRYTLEELVAEMDRLGPQNRPPFEDWGILPTEWPQEDWSDIAPSDEEMGVTDAGRRRSPAGCR